MIDLLVLLALIYYQNLNVFLYLYKDHKRLYDVVILKAWNIDFLEVGLLTDDSANLSSINYLNYITLIQFA